MNDAENSPVFALAPTRQPGSVTRRQRVAQPRQRVPIGPTEAIRMQLGMNKENFSEALGFHPTSYNGELRKGSITKTGALAAQALMQQQQTSGEPMDEVFILRIVNGMPTTTRIGHLQKMRLGDAEFLLVPVKDAQT